MSLCFFFLVVWMVINCWLPNMWYTYIVVNFANSHKKITRTIKNNFHSRRRCAVLLQRFKLYDKNIFYTFIRNDRSNWTQYRVRIQTILNQLTVLIAIISLKTRLLYYITLDTINYAIIQYTHKKRTVSK